MRILLVLLLLLAVSGWSTTHEIYFNSKFTGTSTGAIDAPYKKPSEANSVVSTWRAAEDTTIMYWRDSSVFRESWTIPSGAGPLKIKRYGELGKKPVLSGSVLQTSWSSYASGLGSTWQFTFAATINKFWLSDTTELKKGTDQNALMDSTWIQTGGVVYLRLDAGNPSLYGAEYSRVSQVLFLNGLENVEFNGVEFVKANQAIRSTATATNLQFNQCKFPLPISVSNITANFNSCIFIDNPGPATTMAISGLSTTTFNYCHFKNSPAGLINVSGGKCYINNCNFDNFKNSAVSSSSTDTVFMKNCIVNGIYPHTTPVFSASSGPIIIDNSTPMNNGYVGAVTYSGNIITNNLYKYDPRFVKTSRSGFLSITEDDRGNGADFKKLADYAKSINPEFSLSWCVSEVYQLSHDDSIIIKAVADSGHDITSHSMSHTYLYAGMGLFKIRYTGSAASCTVMVRNDSLILLTGGVDDHVVEIEFDYNKSIGWLVDTVSEFPNYTISKCDNINIRQLVFVAKEDTLWDVKSAIDSIVLDRVKFSAWELDSSKSFLERITGKPCVEYTYPGGMRDSTQIPEIKASGYLGARLAAPTPITMRDTFPLFRLPIQWEAHMQHCVMRLDDNTNSAVKSTNFTPVNISYNSALHVESVGCAVLDGSAYFYRSDTSFHYSVGDYTVGVWVRPTVLNSVNTVFYTGVNADSCLTVYIDNNGAIHYVQRRGGVDVVHITSANNTIQTNQWSRISFRQTIDTISVYKSTDVPAQNRVAMITTNTQPDLYNGITYFGCNYSTGSATNTFTGYMDKIDIGFDNWWRGLSCADQIAMQGCWSSSLTHGDFGGPRDLHKTALDAAASYTGRIKIIGMGPALQILREKGTFINEDSLYIVWNQPDSADYRLRSDSKLVGAGDVSVLSGIPNLINLSGDTITDASGNLRVSSVNIGAYGTYYEIPDTTPSAPTITSVSPSSPRLFKTFEATGTNLSNCKLYLNSVSLGTPTSATSTSISDTALGTTRGFHWLIAEDTLTGMRCSTSSRIYIKNTQLDTVLLGRP